MLANHTSVASVRCFFLSSPLSSTQLTERFAQLFKRMLDQYDRLKKKNAFLDQYKKEKMFSDNLDEFDDARATCDELLKEYKACESPDYISYVSACQLTPTSVLKSNCDSTRARQREERVLEEF